MDESFVFWDKEMLGYPIEIRAPFDLRPCLKRGYMIYSDRRETAFTFGEFNE